MPAHTARPVDQPPTVRQLWELFEPIHAVTYFSDESAGAAERAGYRGFWMGYFAGRLAPLGPVGPAVATALCYGFHRSRAARALPDAWGFAGPDVALGARLAGATATLRRVLGTLVEPGQAVDVEAAADLAWTAAQRADTAGRAMAAANQAQPRPTDALSALWQATTTLREHRGDGHIAALVAADVAPVSAHWLKIAAGETAPAALRASRDWPEPDWRAGGRDLRGRGWLDAHDRLTSAGQAAHQEIEQRTDAAAQSPWTGLGNQETARLARLLGPISAAIGAAGVVPYPNPIGVGRAGS